MSFSLLFVSGCHLVDIFKSHLFFNWFGIALNSQGSWDRQDRDVDCNKFNIQPTGSRQETLQTSPNQLWPKHKQTLGITTTALPTPKASPEDDGQMISRHGVSRYPRCLIRQTININDHQWIHEFIWWFPMISAKSNNYWNHWTRVLHQFLLRSVGHGFQGIHLNSEATVGSHQCCADETSKETEDTTPHMLVYKYVCVYIYIYLNAGLESTSFAGKMDERMKYCEVSPHDFQAPGFPKLHWAKQRNPQPPPTCLLYELQTNQI